MSLTSGRCVVVLLVCCLFCFFPRWQFSKNDKENRTNLVTNCKHKSAQCTQWILISGKSLKQLCFSQHCVKCRAALLHQWWWWNPILREKNGVRAACENHLRFLLLFLPKSLFYPALAQEASALLFFVLAQLLSALLGCWFSSLKEIPSLLLSNEKAPA